MPDLIRERSIVCQTMKISRMWQIALQSKNKSGKLITLTKSLYTTKEQALRAATQLRMLSVRWTKAVRSVECERKKAKEPTWRFHYYTVTPPVEV